MKRWAASFLMLLSVLLPLQPLLVSAQQTANLPACCRRNGKHHCLAAAAMLGSALASSGAQAAFTPPPCPWKLAVTPAIVAAAGTYFMLQSRRVPAGIVTTAQQKLPFLHVARLQFARAPPATRL